MSSDVGEPFQRISIDVAKQKIDTEECTIVDVRQQDEWDSGHVKNAIHIPVDELLGTINQLPESGNLLFICAAGVRSALACEMAASMGIDAERLFNIEEGTPSWIAKGYPTE